MRAGNLYVSDTLNHTIRRSPRRAWSRPSRARRFERLCDATGSAARSTDRRDWPWIHPATSLSPTPTTTPSASWSLATGVVTTVAGQTGVAGSADGANSQAQFYFPSGVAVDTAGNLYIADTDNHTLREIVASGAVSTLAGLAGISGSADGTGTAARFNFPTGVAVDSPATSISQTRTTTRSACASPRWRRRSRPNRKVGLRPPGPM